MVTGVEVRGAHPAVLILLLAALVLLPHSTSAQITSPFVCSAGAQDGNACTSDADCPAGACVRVQGVCDGGDDDGVQCTCAGASCGTEPACSDDPGLGSCSGGIFAGNCCDPGENCAGGSACSATQKVCLSGGNKGFSCLTNAQCAGAVCGSSGNACHGGNFDGFACVDDGDCPAGQCQGIGTPTPKVATQTATMSPVPSTSTPIPTGTQTHTATIRLTPTTGTNVPTRTPTPTPRIVHLDVGSAIGAPGDAVQIRVSLTSGGTAVVATANTLTFSPPVLLDLSACHVNSSIGRTLNASIIESTDTATTVQIFVQATVNASPIPDGTLYTCLFRTSPAAVPGTYTIKNGALLAFDPTGAAIEPVAGNDGTVGVSLIGRVCIGDCGLDGTVTVDELIKGVAIALGNLPIDYCLAMDANADGAVTVDELVTAVGNALNGCIVPPTPLPTPTPTPSPAPTTIFVRTGGDDGNNGIDAQHAFRTITRAAQVAFSGYRIVVGPGRYTEGVTTTTTGLAPHGLMFVADASGALTGDPAGPVIVDATGTAAGAGFKLTNSPDSSVDGFTITGAVDAGIVIKDNTDNFTVQNCIVHDNPGPGIRVQDSAGTVIFNNLIYSNGQQGIALVGQQTGAPNARIFSNTIVANGDDGITVGSSHNASPGALIRNNIVQANGIATDPPQTNVKVFTSPPSDVGYDENFDLIFPATYLPLTLEGNRDIDHDAQFVFSDSGDFHLQPDSPAIDGGTALPPALEAMLFSRTTTGSDLDSGTPDLGYHYLP
jgi:parallel beta-helix repeat protein